MSKSRVKRIRVQKGLPTDRQQKALVLDIDAAVEITGQLRFAKTADDWDDMIYDVTKEAVEAALGTTEDTGG